MERAQSHVQKGLVTPQITWESKVKKSKIEIPNVKIKLD